MWAAEPEDVSLLHVLFYIHSAGSARAAARHEGGAQQDRFVGGSQLLALGIAERARATGACSARRCAGSSTARDGVTVHADGVTVRGAARDRRDPADARRRGIAYDPPLPGYRDQLTQRMPQGAVIKCIAVYDEPFWRADGLTGQAASDAGPVRVTFDNSPPDGSPGVLLGFLEGRRARELGRGRPGGAPRGRARTASPASSARARPSPRRTSSSTGPTRSGPAAATAATSRPARWTAFGRGAAGADRAAPLGRRRVRATVWSGYMDGAVRSGEGAAAAILRSPPFGSSAGREGS